MKCKVISGYQKAIASRIGKGKNGFEKGEIANIGITVNEMKTFPPVGAFKQISDGKK